MYYTVLAEATIIDELICLAEHQLLEFSNALSNSSAACSLRKHGSNVIAPGKFESK